MKLFVLLFTLVGSAFAQQNQKLPNGQWAYYGEEFYKALNSNTQIEKELLNRVLNLSHTYSSGNLDIIDINCKSRTCYNPESVNYDKLKKIMYGEIDLLKDAQGTYVLDVYCEKKFYFTDIDSASRIPQLNIEHTWPQSKFSSKYPKDVQKSDMHHLYLADSDANAFRSNNPFGMVAEAENRLGGEGCKESKSGFMEDKAVYTPPVAHRGNVARSLFYFSVRYNLEISEQEEGVLREWHRNDPIDGQEKRRHEGISKYQKVRNPFIDHPEIVDRISNF